jgi:hypothetical protein
MSPSALLAQPAVVNLLIYQGDDFAFTLTVKNPDGSNTDLTGATFKAQIRDSAGSSTSTLLATFTTSVAANVVTLSLAHADSAKLPLSSVWDCQMTRSGGSVVTLAAGSINLSPDVSV